MENLIIWPEALDWQEVRRVFVIMSLIAVFVSSIINRYLKRFPVLAVQLSILATLAIYPMINFYALVSTDYDVFSTVEKADPANFGVLVFLSPLPVCILTAIVFFTFRNRKTAKKPSLQPHKSELIPKAVSCIISLTVGSAWLSINMLFHKDAFHVTVIMFMFYTILGFIMYLVSEAVLLAVKQLIAKCNRDNAG